jgi:hypothetical protein
MFIILEKFSSYIFTSLYLDQIFIISGVSEKEKKIIVDIHNTVRREVSPTASNMMLMVIHATNCICHKF